MRIILRWPKTNPVTARDLDSHLQIPYLTPRVAGTECDGGSDRYDKCHLWYATTQAADNATTVTGVSTLDYHQYYDIVSSGDYVTLDKDDSSSSAPPGDETMTITKVRSGTYSFSVHNLSDMDNSTDYFETNLRRSRAKVKVFYCPVGTDCNCNACPAAGNLVKKKFHVPNANGTLWRVFTFNSGDSGGSGFTRVRTMTYEEDPLNVY